MRSPILIMLVGIPYSGKSYIANQLAHKYQAVIHSSDELREELFGNVDHQTSNPELFRVLNNRVIDDLRAGKAVIYDATNINRRRRKEFVERAKRRSGCSCICCYVNTPLDVCFERAKTRERVVPREVVKRMHLTLEKPEKDEGWDKIITVYTRKGGVSSAR